jgi:hypothetical protein
LFRRLAALPETGDFLNASIYRFWQAPIQVELAFERETQGEAGIWEETITLRRDR